MIRISLNFKYGGIAKIEVSSQGICNFQNLENETLIIADYEYTKKYRFAMVDTKLCPKDANILYQF